MSGDARAVVIGCYDIRAEECFKLVGTTTFGFWFSLSGVTPGNRNEQAIQRVSAPCATVQFCSRKVRLVDALLRISAMQKQKTTLLRMLARCFLAGDSSVEQIVSRSGQMLGRNWRWLRPLARRFIRSFENRTRPREPDVIRFLLEDHGFRTALSKHFLKLKVAHWRTSPQRMQPVAAAERWPIPPIDSVGALADWFGLTPGQLQWFADLKGQEYRRDIPRLRHYHYRILVKLSGRLRLIEAPKSRLKQLQQRILSEILEKVPVHPAAHGFVKRRSIKSFVTPHVGQRVVLRMDLQDFFPCLGGARVQALFRTLGYPESVAALLAGICTNSAPRNLWARNQSTFDAPPAHFREARELYSRVHLPQGAPTSPMLANLAAYRVDCRLRGLAETVGAHYTRYADDLVFSGGVQFEERVERFSIHVAAILAGEGFSVHHRKTRIMRQGVRQHVAGLVANQRVNVRRTDFDRLKAILTNCVRMGAESQNRDRHPNFRAHLEGRIGFVEMINSAKGERLRRIFEQIRW